ncbi:MAG: hydantoinase B/oxoprolinase family protein [Bacillota bacterium]
MDPITLLVISNSLVAAAEEMDSVQAGTSSSLNIKEGGGCSSAIFTKDGEMLAHGKNRPLISGLFPTFINKILKTHPLHTFSPGDALITNDPYITGSNITDIFILWPVYCNSMPLALAACACGHPDMGGSSPGSMSTLSREIFQEGLRIAPVKLMKKGNLNRDVIMLLTGNIRTRNFIKDLWSQIFACQAAEKALCKLAGKYGHEKLRKYMKEVITLTETNVKAVICSMPAGEFSSKKYIEGGFYNFYPLTVKTSIKKDGDSLTVDFSGTDPQAAGPINATAGITASCVYNAVASAFFPDVHVNEGLIKSIKVIAPEGTLVNAVFPAPVACSHHTAQGITEAVKGCLSLISPDIEIPAENGGPASLAIGGQDSYTGNYYSFKALLEGGQGASALSDGQHGYSGGIIGASGFSIELAEEEYPVLFSEYSFSENSGGPGEYRGGLGVKCSFTLLADNTSVSVSTSHNVIAPAGKRGGLPGGLSSVTTEKTQQEINPYGSYTGIPEKNSAFSIVTAGGGGCGNPLDRNPNLVRNDVLEGLVTLDAAEEIYGVVLVGKNFEIDEEATKKKRNEKL